MKAPFPPPQERASLFVLTRSGPQVVFALALTVQLAGLALVMDRHPQNTGMLFLGSLGLVLTGAGAGIALVSVNRSREQVAHTLGLLDETIDALPAT